MKLKIEKIANQLTETAQTTPKPWDNQKGVLNNSIKVSVEQDKDGEQTIVLSFEYYGLFLDAGVKGRGGLGVTQAGFFGIKEEPYSFKRVPKRTLKKNPYPGYLMGIAPRPWIQNVIDALTEEILDFEKVNLPQEIKQKLVGQLKNLNRTSADEAITVTIS
jgi:hypothetical protein